jgi:hypothetical protein
MVLGLVSGLASELASVPVMALRLASELEFVPVMASGLASVP